MTLGLEDFSDRIMSLKPWDSAMRINSNADSTIPLGVSPKRFMIRSDSEPWLVPMRRERPSALARRTSGVNASCSRSSSSA